MFLALFFKTGTGIWIIFIFIAIIGLIFSAIRGSLKYFKKIESNLLGNTLSINILDSLD